MYMEKIYIVIAVYKRLELTIRCLNSLIHQTYSDFHVIVVDHCEGDSETQQFISTLDDRFIHLKGLDSMWWTDATNFGVKHALNMEAGSLENSFVLTLNNDLTVRENYLEELITTYSKYKPCLVGSVSVDSEAEEKIDFAGCKWNIFTSRMPDLFDKATKYSDIKNLDVIVTDLLPGRGMLIPMIVFQKIGLFDNEAFPHYVSDYDFSLMANKKGYKLLINPRAVVSSIVKESGDRFDKDSKISPSISFILDSQKSIKSPINITNRWNWAKKHTKFSRLYFTIDSMRIIASYAVYSTKYYLQSSKADK